MTINKHTRGDTGEENFIQKRKREVNLGMSRSREIPILFV